MSTYSFVSKSERPFKAGCDEIIKQRKHFCHVPAASWEISQEQVCELCAEHNAAFLSLCAICGVTQITSERWNAGSRMCGDCFEHELRRRTDARRKSKRFTIVVSKKKLAEPKVKIGFAAAAFDRPTK